MLYLESVKRGHKTFVELGPGASSVILAHALGDRAQLYGVEHDERYCQELRVRLDDHNLDSYTLIHAPLVEQDLESRLVHWYDRRALERLPIHIDVLLVDGPPNFHGTSNRSPAWPALRERMRPGALVIVDDTGRVDERRMVSEWRRDGSLSLLEDRGSFMVLEVR